MHADAGSESVIRVIDNDEIIETTLLVDGDSADHTTAEPLAETQPRSREFPQEFQLGQLIDSNAQLD